MICRKVCYLKDDKKTGIKASLKKLKIKLTYNINMNPLLSYS